MQIQFYGLPSDKVRSARKEKKDAYGNPFETHRSDGSAYPCRHCLGEIPAGEDYLILAWRPFETDNPYAETGPIFLCAKECLAAEPSAKVPSILRSPRYLVKGYSADERIVYGTGQVVPTEEISAYAQRLLSEPHIEFVDIRSAQNNCFQCRVQRA